MKTSDLLIYAMNMLVLGLSLVLIGRIIQWHGFIHTAGTVIVAIFSPACIYLSYRHAKESC